MRLVSYRARQFEFCFSLQVLSDARQWCLNPEPMVLRYHFPVDFAFATNNQQDTSELIYKFIVSILLTFLVLLTTSKMESSRNQDKDNVISA